jgi:signal peptidase
VEIAPVPHRPPPLQRRWLFVGLLLLAPVTLLVLLPAVLGLDRYVVTDNSMGDTMGRGSVVLARNVPAGDLRVGNVITFVPPDQSGHARVTHRIVSLDGGYAVTRGDASDAVDPQRLELDRPTYARVLLHVPWVGYPFVGDGGLLLLLAGASLAVGLGAVATGRREVRRRRVLDQKGSFARSRVPVA